MASKGTIQTKITWVFLCLIVGIFAAVIYYATEVFVSDKVYSLKHSNSMLAQAQAQALNQVMWNLRQGAYAQIKELTRSKRRRKPTKRQFSPPNDYFIGLSVKDPNTKRELRSAYFNKRFDAKLKWGGERWVKVWEGIPLQKISTQRHFLKRIDFPEGKAFVLALPLLLNEGRPGVLAAVVWEREILEKLGELQSTQNVTFVTDETGMVIFHPFNSHVGTSIKTKSYSRLLNHYKSKKSGTGTFEGTTIYDRRVLAGYSWTGASGLMVFTQSDREKAFQSYRMMIYKLVVISLLALVMSLLLGKFLTGKIAGPLKSILGMTEEIKGGNYDVHVNVDSNDEVGQVAESFNDMGVQLLNRENKVIDAQSQLVQSGKLAAFGQLGTGIAHEIKNPIAGIVGNAQLLLSKRPITKDPKLVDQVKSIELEAKRCQSIIDSFAQFTKRDKMVLQENTIEPIVDKAVKMVEHHLQISKIRIKITVDEDLPTILCQPSFVQQVLLNIFLNAKESMPSGGELAINVERQGSRFINVTVVDTGVGIHANNLKRIFEPFYTTKERGQGPGLGLSIAQQIMDDHGGTIVVDSRRGEGTTVTLHFPIPTEQQIAESKKDVQTAARLDELTREVVRNQVVKFGDATREIRTSRLTLDLEARKEEAANRPPVPTPDPARPPVPTPSPPPQKVEPPKETRVEKKKEESIPVIPIPHAGRGKKQREPEETKGGFIDFGSLLASDEPSVPLTPISSSPAKEVLKTVAKKGFVEADFERTEEYVVPAKPPSAQPATEEQTATGAGQEMTDGFRMRRPRRKSEGGS